MWRVMLLALSLGSVSARVTSTEAPNPATQLDGGQLNNTGQDESAAAFAVLSDSELKAEFLSSVTVVPSIPSQTASDVDQNVTSTDIANRFGGWRPHGSNVGWKPHGSNCESRSVLRKVESLKTDLLKKLGENKNMLSSGQDSILSHLSTISGTVTTVCDFSDLKNGQTKIITDIRELAVKLDGLEAIEAAVAAAKDMIIDGQTVVNTNIADVSTEIRTSKVMLTDGQTAINNNIVGISTEIETAKHVIIAGQTTINNNIDEVSAALEGTKTMILSELTAINTKLHALESGRDEILDQLKDQDEKLDAIIDKLMGTTAAGPY